MCCVLGIISVVSMKYSFETDMALIMFRLREHGHTWQEKHDYQKTGSGKTSHYQARYFLTKSKYFHKFTQYSCGLKRCVLSPDKIFLAKECLGWLVEDLVITTWFLNMFIPFKLIWIMFQFKSTGHRPDHKSVLFSVHWTSWYDSMMYIYICN